MTLDLRQYIKPEFQHSKIMLPGGMDPIIPEHWSGDVVIHLPFKRNVEKLLLEELARQRFMHAMREGLPLPKWPLGIEGGAASAWAFPNGGRTKLLDGTFDIDSDTWKMALFLSTSNIVSSPSTQTTYASLTNEVAAAFGYSTGGASITLTLAGTTTVTVDISSDPVWTASGGSITARAAGIYEVSGNLLCNATLDSAPADVTATDGNTLTVAANVSGVFTLA